MTNDSLFTLDRREILERLFHPRPEPEIDRTERSPLSLRIPVEAGIAVGARFHVSREAGPNLLFFHGNGEIAADYDEMGDLYNRMGINFIAVDYRGYGRSNGSPTATGMLRDVFPIFSFVTAWLTGNGNTGRLFVMGRSLGSASAIEIASKAPDRIDGLVLESAFAYAAPLLRLFGIDPDAIGYRDETGFRHIKKIGGYSGPLLVIHAEGDHLIPFREGEALFDAAPSTEKELVPIPKADHNSLLHYGITAYIECNRAFCSEALIRRLESSGERSGQGLRG